MTFVTQGKTNWKLLLIIIILAIIVGGGCFWYTVKQETPFTQLLKIKKQEKIESYIKIIQPKANQVVTNPIEIEGEIRIIEKVMNKEASVEIIDDNGQKLYPLEGRFESGITATNETKSFNLNVSYVQPSSKKGTIKIFAYLPTEGFVPTEGVLESWSPKTLIEIPVIFKEDLLTIPNDWHTYSNTEANFSFRYPKDWKITSEFFYETPAGIKSDAMTVVLESNSKAGISINMRQAMCSSPCWCREVKGNLIQTCSEDSGILEIFNKIVSTFRTIQAYETADWKTYRNEELGIEFNYLKDWGILTAKFQKNLSYTFSSENEKIKTIIYHKPSNILAFIEKGEKYKAAYGDENYQEILKIIFPNKEIKTIYTVSPKDVEWYGAITGINISPNGKYVSFILSVYEISKPLMVNIETNKNILEGVHVNLVPDEDIFWSQNNEVLAIRSEINEYAGIGICGIFVSDYGDPEKLNEVFSIPWEKHINGIHIGKVQFVDNEKLSFEVGERLEEYIYNARTKELTKIK
jgi:hypothetical protein